MGNENKKGLKLQKKKSVVKKKSSTKNKKSDLRTGYNEGAEETKNWLGDSQSTFNQDVTL